MEKTDFVTFDQVTAYMDSFTNSENRSDSSARRTYRLDRMRALLGHFGNPQDSYKCIHVAGSKGKGSTASFLAVALRASGFRTGLYMSPHVVDYRERFTLAGEFFPDPLLLAVANTIQSGLEGFHFCETFGENVPTTFELYTLFAFLLFREAGCQWAVIETGMGGRLDATNVIVPAASIITPIELEHTEILGKTIPLIAAEKSKIIKKGVPVFVSKQLPEAREVFRKEAEEQESQAFFLEVGMVREETFLPKYAPGTEERETVKLEFRNGLKTELSLRLIGNVQADNCALALLALYTLGLYRPGITEKAMEECTIPGRMERVFYRKPVFLDGAHTPKSMENLTRTFRTVYQGTGGVAIFCCVSGKDYESLCSIILKSFNTVIVSRPGTFKKSNPALIAQTLESKAPVYCSTGKKNIILETDVDKALARALALCEDGQAILVTGSFYMVGEVKEALCRLTGAK